MNDRDSNIASGPYRRNARLARFATHLIVLVIVFVLPEMLLSWGRTMPKFVYIHIIGYIIVFYFNYYLLIDKYLFRRKRIWLYFIINLFFVVSFLFLIFGVHYLCYPPLMPSAVDDVMPPRPPELTEKGWIMMGLHSLFSRDFLMMVLSICISIALKLSEKWLKWEQYEQKMAVERKEIELKNLKNQLNPHFLFNALNSIYSLTLSQPDNAGNAVLKLSSILRYMLYETDRKNVSLSEEMNVIENYLGLQKLRLTDKTRLSFERTGVADHYRIAPLLLVPLIENAFKYGVDSSEESFIDINITIEEGRLSMTIRNKIVRQGINKIVGGKSGSRQETKSEGQGYRQGGIGIKNIRRRLELLYPSSHTLKAEEQNGEFFVYLSLPLGKEIKTVQE